MKTKSIDEIQGHCERCEAPVFLNRSDDQYGNAVVTLNCWNGHYQWINIEGIESCRLKRKFKPLNLSSEGSVFSNFHE